MFVDEARWTYSAVVALFRLFPAGKSLRIFNVGSSTKRFRQIDQPHIDQEIFDKLPEFANVIHNDIKRAPGVDSVGSILSKTFRESVCGSYDVVLCNNLMEHVDDIPSFVAALDSFSQSYLVITVPRLYPYHNDPIDNLFRPAPSDICRMFPKRSSIVEEVIVINECYLQFLLRNKRLIPRLLIRLLLPIYKTSSWLKVVFDVMRILERFQVSCVVLSPINSEDSFFN